MRFFFQIFVTNCKSAAKNSQIGTTKETNNNEQQQQKSWEGTLWKKSTCCVAKTNSTTEGMGILVAKKEPTNELLWKVQVYKVEYIKGLETDVQDVFIKVWNNFICLTIPRKKRNLKNITQKTQLKPEEKSIEVFLNFFFLIVSKIRLFHFIIYRSLTREEMFILLAFKQKLLKLSNKSQKRKW